MTTQEATDIAISTNSTSLETGPALRKVPIRLNWPSEPGSAATVSTDPVAKKSVIIDR